jgi:hypothetical protein
MASNPDDWIAAAASFVRNSFGNRAGFVSPDDVKRLRAANAARTEPWTEAELRTHLPQPLANAKDWKLTASAGAEGCTAAVDGKVGTRWDSKGPQKPGQWFQIEFPEAIRIAGLRLDSSRSPDDYPRRYQVQLSDDGVTWGAPVTEGRGGSAITEIKIPGARSRFVRVTQTGTANNNFWSIHELQVYAAQ